MRATSGALALLASPPGAPTSRVATTGRDLPQRTVSERVMTEATHTKN
jgi:hypothetical protein